MFWGQGSFQPVPGKPLDKAHATKIVLLYPLTGRMVQRNASGGKLSLKKEMSRPPLLKSCPGLDCFHFPWLCCYSLGGNYIPSRLDLGLNQLTFG